MKPSKDKEFRAIQEQFTAHDGKFYKRVWERDSQRQQEWLAAMEALIESGCLEVAVDDDGEIRYEPTGKQPEK